MTGWAMFLQPLISIPSFGDGFSRFRSAVVQSWRDANLYSERHVRRRVALDFHTRRWHTQRRKRALQHSRRYLQSLVRDVVVRVLWYMPKVSEGCVLEYEHASVVRSQVVDVLSESGTPEVFAHELDRV